MKMQHNKYLLKIAGIPDLFPKKIGSAIERFAEGPLNSAGIFIRDNKKPVAAAAATGVIGAGLGYSVGKNKKQSEI
jgi:hypothetical protein